MAGTRYLASPVLLKQILFCGELRRHVLFPLKSRQQGTILSSHIHHSTMGRLCSGGTSTEVIGNLFLSRKRRVCSPDVGVSYPFPLNLQTSVFCKVWNTKCELHDAAPFSSDIISTSLSSTDVKSKVITLIETEDDLDIFMSQVTSELNLSETSTTSMQILRPLVQKLVSMDCDCRGISAMLVANPGILSVQMDRLLGNIDYLHVLGLNYRQLLKTLDRNARLGKASLQNLQSRVKQLRKLGFVEGQLQRLIADWPHVLTMGSVQLNAVVKLLMEKCRFPRAEVLTILSDSPAVLKEDLQSIELGFQYCYFRMGIQNNSEMTQAKIFKYSLDHLRCRHLLLERLGLYAPPNNRGHFATKNPSLSRIIDSSDGRFTEKVAKITMEEYEAFSKILLEEIKVEQFNKDHLGGGNLDEFTDEDSHYDDSEDSIDSDSEFWDTDDTVSQTQPFDFDKVDYRKKR
ncbi:transcription termination factor 4, mitochondrial-like isoform X1 [Lytechinus variegatus]|uniref:transcription termination factor 4, mitochondrial-like isoform X1 n=1 Tax=Lytechinus variegatus TaxID=7654 RepID=UPI001BB20B55|nr:transcription termination factor 4, mitochondrial-like isoform X1 [Lytechinus variegatus]